MTGRNQIQGWKEIAACLGRDERTAKRWEKQRGLPVRRIPGGGRANVYLLRSELDAWLAGAAVTNGARAPHADESSVVQDGVASPAAGAEQGGASVGPAGTEARRGAGIADATQSPSATQAAELPAQTGAKVADAATVGAAPSAHAVERRQVREVVFAILAVAAVVFVIVEAMFDRSRNWDAPTLQAELARPEAAAPAAAAGREEERAAERNAADELTMEGLYLSEQRTPASLAAAKGAFEEAIAKDPGYAPAHSGLAVTYLLLREYATMPHDEAYRLAAQAAGRALALDPNLAGAHAVMGFIDFFSRWRAEEATREFETAIRIDPNSAMAHHWYGSMLMHQGRSAEALAELDRAQHLSPTSNAILATKALALGYAGHRREGVRLLESLERTDPVFGAPHRNLAFLSLLEPRDMPRYLSEMRRFAELRREPEEMRLLPAATGAYRRGGEPAMWAQTLATERALHPDTTHPTLLMAESETALGQTDRAIEDLSRLAAERASPMIGLVTDPVLLPLHSDPRFRRIAVSIGLAMPAETEAPADKRPTPEVHRVVARLPASAHEIPHSRRDAGA